MMETENRNVILIDSRVLNYEAIVSGLLAISLRMNL